MATLNLGKVKLTWKGDYSAGALYAKDDLVAYQGSTWICKTNATTGVEPVDGSGSWSVMARGVIASAFAQALLTAADAPAGRTALGLGSAAVANLGTAAGNAFPTDSTTPYMRGLLLALTAGEARTALALGTAAQGTITTSNTDTTAGRLLKVGDFGIGSAISSGAVDMDSYTIPGSYITPASGLINLPSGWAQGRHVVVVGGGTTYTTQMIFTGSAATAKFAFRRYNGTAWTSFVEVFNTGNVSNYAQTLLDDADAATARATLGLGNAALATITSSTTDQTTGNLVKNGDKSVCTAWVNFNGTGTVAIRDSFNVSSITDNGTGNYTVNFSANMANTNYVRVANSKQSDDSATDAGHEDTFGAAVGSIGIVTRGGAGGGYVLEDKAHIGLVILGGK